MVVFSSTIKIHANNLDVSASILASLPTTIPVIVSPSNGFVSPSNGIEISGSCPVTSPAVIVTIVRNGIFIGSTYCNPNGTYKLLITLVPGSNEIYAQIVTVTNQTGQPGPKSTFIYKSAPSVGDENITIDPNTNETAGESLLLVTQNSFLSFIPGKSTSFTILISGGVAPYNMEVNWGDGKIEKLTHLEAGEKALEHKYSVPGKYKIVITVVDKNGKSYVLGVVTSTLVKNSPLSFANGITNSQDYFKVSKNLTYALVGFSVFGSASILINNNIKIKQLNKLKKNVSKKRKKL